MKSGFTLIEILIAIAISAAISVALFFVFSQTQKNIIKIENLISNDIPILIFQDRFEKDITGAFVPENWPDKNKDSKKEDKKGSKEENESEKIFFSESESDLLKFFTFITSNPFQPYGDFKPRIARVCYSVEKDSSGEYYNIFRQELSELDYSRYEKEKVSKFIILKRVKNIKIKYFYFEAEKENKKQQESKPEKKEDKPLKETGVWNYPRKKENSDNEKLPKIPQFIELFITLYDLNLARESDFVFRYVVYGQPVLQKEAENKKEPALENSPNSLLSGRPNQEVQARRGADRLNNVFDKYSGIGSRSIKSLPGIR